MYREVELLTPEKVVYFLEMRVREVERDCVILLFYWTVHAVERVATQFREGDAFFLRFFYFLPLVCPRGLTIRAGRNLFSSVFFRICSTPFCERKLMSEDFIGRKNTLWFEIESRIQVVGRIIYDKRIQE